MDNFWEINKDFNDQRIHQVFLIFLKLCDSNFLYLRVEFWQFLEPQLYGTNIDFIKVFDNWLVLKNTPKLTKLQEDRYSTNKNLIERQEVFG